MNEGQKILVLGGTGMLGQAVCRAIEADGRIAVEASYPKIDIGDLGALRGLATEEGPVKATLEVINDHGGLGDGWCRRNLNEKDREGEAEKHPRADGVHDLQISPVQEIRTRSNGNGDGSH